MTAGVNDHCWNSFEAGSRGMDSTAYLSLCQSVSLCGRLSQPVIPVSLLSASSAGLWSHNSRLHQLSVLGRVMAGGSGGGLDWPVTQASLFISLSRARECQHVPTDVLSVAAGGCY